MKHVYLAIFLLATNAWAALPERAELLPAKARWTDLPSNVIHVVTDRRGRAWFEIDGFAPVDQIKAQVEQADALEAPWVQGAFILLFDSKNRVWLEPRSGPDTLLCYDLAHHTWSEHPVWRDPKAVDAPDYPPDGYTALAHESKDGILYFAGQRGIYTLADTWNYQPLYQANEREHLFYQDNPSYELLQLAEGSDGCVYAWSAWGTHGKTGTIGAWRHTGDQWQRILTDYGPDRLPAHLLSLAPLDNNKLLVFPDMGEDVHAFITTLPPKTRTAKQLQTLADIPLLGDNDFAVRDAASERILSNQYAMTPLLRVALDNAADPEVHARLDTLLAHVPRPDSNPLVDGRNLIEPHFLEGSNCDARGNGLFWARETTDNIDGKFYRISPDGDVGPVLSVEHDKSFGTLFVTRGHQAIFGRLHDGLATLEDPAKPGAMSIRTVFTDPTDGDYFNVVAEDAAGRLYVADQLNEGEVRPFWCRIAIIDRAAPEKRQTLPSEAYPFTSDWASFTIDSTGHAWAKFNLLPFLSRFDGHAWMDQPLPAGVDPVKGLLFLQPLVDGSLIAVTSDHHALFFDRGAWTQFSSLAALVESNFARLGALVTDKAPSARAPCLYKDAGGNLWNMDGDVAVFTGAQWIHMIATADSPVVAAVKRIFPVANASKMLLVGTSDLAYAQVIDGRIALTRFPVRDADRLTASGANPDGLMIDSHRRAWVPLNWNHTLIVDDQGARESDTLLNARLEDRAGRIWFVDPWGRKLSALLPDGKVVEFPEDSLFDLSSLVEDQPGSLWLTTALGVSHLSVTDSNGKVTVRHLGDYTCKLPRGNTHGLWLDGSGNLWTIASHAESSYELWRLDVGNPQ